MSVTHRGINLTLIKPLTRGARMSATRGLAGDWPAARLAPPSTQATGGGVAGRVRTGRPRRVEWWWWPRRKVTGATTATCAAADPNGARKTTTTYGAARGVA